MEPLSDLTNAPADTIVIHHMSSASPAKKGHMARVLEELACAVCLEVCERPTTTPCGHSFCRPCLVSALASHRRCPKCRAPVPASFSCPVNTALWNTIQLLFPDTVERARAPAGGEGGWEEGSPEAERSPPRRTG
eukprot:CAMPEP_0118939446 /NCGR_PEP_ID=MMETSP1169-20130426/28919_1 /TAXON_ID=36882 /ORGANISM="Pyramimonas obovata, Strain CCMP722" /LENGTH=134 /DNA_ID=CAMNT_0006883717 /DNA_START=341 /DNA_END=741 /DNA_ORIENTATION=-